ncbi:uncharacterized protein LOC118647391 [Monomorium pharaonis]|uniref:uncharacterized protein LOC118647391 n=1 Tax=Monomorium pharaonis TaxID=307658 RepID=UPI0017478A5E|nr:uncharacterized protein LOC118647391 [Monomorium pharaonis]
MFCVIIYSKMSCVWKYFTKTEKNVAKCTLYSKEVKTSGTTSNLFTHLKTKYLFAFDECMKKKKKKNELTINKDDLKENVEGSNTCTSRHSRSRSPLSKSIDNLSQSSTSSHFSQNTLSEVLNKRTSFEKGGSRNIAITEALVNMICKDNMPTRTVEKGGFIQFVKTLCPLYKIPSRSTLTILLEEKYKVCRSQLKEMLDHVHYVS